MSLLNIYKRLISGKTPQSDSVFRYNCPHEADVLAYLESRLSVRERRRIETHFAGCEDCRELIALFTRGSEEQLNEIASKAKPVAEDEVKRQAARVIAYAERDERKASKESVRDRRGFLVTYPWLATAVLIFCALGIVIVFWLTSGPTPEEAAMQTLADAMKGGRYIPVRISGNLPHSKYSETRGRSDGDNTKLDGLLARLNDAEKESAPVQQKQMLARVLLAYDHPDKTKRALSILNQLAAGGANSPELFNDIGVAYFQRGDYDNAINNFKIALSKSHNYGEALFNLAIAEEKFDRKGDAEADWRRFISIAPDGNWKAEAEGRLKSLQDSTR